VAHFNYFGPGGYFNYFGQVAYFNYFGQVAYLIISAGSLLLSMQPTVIISVEINCSLL